MVNQYYTREEALLEVGIGWKNLVNEIYDELNTDLFPVTCIKEKFGALRIYVGWHIATVSIEDANAIENLLDDVEERSLSICELCGNIGQMYQTRSRWLKTLCTDCAGKIGATICATDTSK